MTEQHPADALVEALVDYAEATHREGPYYVAGYLNTVLRQLVDSLPEGLEKRAAHITLRQRTEHLRGMMEKLK